MDKKRADLGFGAALEGLDTAEWQPTEPRAANDRSRQAAGEAAEAAGFKSREPKAAAKQAQVEPAAVSVPTGQGAQLRRRRTGRNAQFNLKARPETIAAFCAIADRQDWGLGETLEKAVSLLEREYPA